MNTSKARVSTVGSILFAITCYAGTSTLAYAEDVVASKDQSDEQINVWVDNAPLKLFISQLAQITDRDVSIEGEMSGQVSGRFKGSMVDTLDLVGKQFPVLFDLGDDVLGVVADTDGSSATIALGDVVLEDEMKTTLLGDVLPGNKLEIRSDEVFVSGHPSYVSRVAKVLFSAVARSDTKMIEKISAVTDTPAIEDVAAVADTQVSEPVFDKAAQMILDEAAEEVEAAMPSETASIAEATTTEIRWVTDIDGFETF